MKILDKKKFDENFNLFDKKSLDEIITIFQDEYLSKQKLIQSSIDNCDFESLKFNLHSLKGVISNFETGTLYQLIRNLEILAKDERESEIRTLLPLFFIKGDLLLQDLLEIQSS